jgi:hypothetical protein
MRNQFFYTRTVRTEVPATETSEAHIEVREYRDSLNLDMVIRSVTLETGAVVVLLNDIHEQVTQEPIINTHTNKVKGYREIKANVQSEISLYVEDGRRFFELTNAGSEAYYRTNSPFVLYIFDL